MQRALPPWLLTVGLLMQACAGAQQAPVTSPVFTASHRPGWSGGSWELRVGADGRTELLDLSEGGTRVFVRKTLSPGQLHLLQRVFTQIGFWSLQRSYRASATDQPTISLYASFENRERRVEVYGPQEFGDDPDVQAFLTAWRLLLAFVPPSNCRFCNYEFQPYRQ